MPAPLGGSDHDDRWRGWGIPTSGTSSSPGGGNWSCRSSSLPTSLSIVSPLWNCAAPKPTLYGMRSLSVRGRCSTTDFAARWVGQ